MAEGNNRTFYPGFQRLVLSSYQGVLPDDQLLEEVQRFWEQFDPHKKNSLDFGEFIGFGLLFNVTIAKDTIRKRGIEATFAQYADDSFMAEPHFMQLMSDHCFFVTTSTDVHKLMRMADADNDGLVSLSDFQTWVDTADMPMAAQQQPNTQTRRGGRRVAPPPEPEG